jgi:hypothetical protein
MDKVKLVALALEKDFKRRVSAGSGIPFEETGVTPPSFKVWEDYAKVAVKEIEGETK